MATLSGVAAAALLCATQAVAAPPPSSVPVGTDSFTQSGATDADSGPFSFLSSRSSYLLGDMWGLRTGLSRYGISVALLETSEYLGNVSGGIQKGFDYDGLTQLTLQLDTQQAFGVYGGTFNVSALQIHGSNLSASNLGTLQTASGIEADQATRLWELWYQQKFGDEDRLDVKIGQQSLDQEFMVSSNALLFVNTMFGWAMVPSADLPGGGPAYPLSALGIRVRARPTESWTLLAGVFNGGPAYDNSGDSQVNNPHGVSFPVNGGALAIAEAQYAWPAMGATVTADQSSPLAGTLRFGAWYDTESFADERYATDGLSLANPASSGNPEMHHGDYGLYAVLDQVIWQDADDPDRNICGFLRPMWTPQTDRNLVDFSANAGLTFHDPFPQRDDDTFGIGLGYAHVSGSVSGLDRDTAFYTGTPTPTRGSETFVEITYQYQIKPWWQLQPDIQYVFNPGAGVGKNADGSGSRIGNELVIGIRTNIAF